ncbi:MAG TPA: GGDEF domain-containing protein [Solirubrobacteraceae bacterium]|jgi:diguanylate cyclase (GGDEF)-like protein|nr:GGDEF domain-containing protein [Solirubrobacteraceae bacterium]
MRATHPEEGSALAYGVRLLATVAVTVALIALAGYLLLEGALGQRQIAGGQLHELRLVLGLIGILAPIGGVVAFYLLGGRRLMRDHRLVLQMATRDGLTDLPNQCAFEHEFPDAVAAATRYREPLGLILADVDCLERINERHGHEQGDTVLRVVSGVLRSSRPGDRPYRVGGDHFAIVLAHTDDEGAGTLARRIARDFSQAGVEISMGSSALRPGMSAETLRAEADTALYEAKQRGGDRAVAFDEIRARVSPSDVVVVASGAAPAAGA